MNINRLKELLNYNPETGDFFWAVKPNKSKKAGDKAGYTPKNSYAQIGIDGKILFAHRVAWALYYNEQPPKMIDHINGNKSDNRICNLRAATNSENMRNTTKTARNSTGYKGVCFNKKSQKYQANIGHNYKCIYLGLFDTAEEAHAAYCKAAAELHGQYFKP